MDTTNAKLKSERRRRKKKNEGINKKDTLVKKAFELGEFDGVIPGTGEPASARYSSKGWKSQATC